MVLEAQQRYPRPKLRSSSSHEDPRQPPGWDSRLPKLYFPCQSCLFVGWLLGLGSQQASMAVGSFPWVFLISQQESTQWFCFLLGSP